MALGDAAQLAAAHCPNEWTLDPAVCSLTDPRNALARNLFFGSGVAALPGTILLLIYLFQRDGRLSWPRWLIRL